MIAASIWKLFFGSKSKGSEFPSWEVVICNQCIQCLSILAVCLIYLKQFLDSLESGFIGIDDLARQGQSAQTQIQDSMLSNFSSDIAHHDRQVPPTSPPNPGAHPWTRTCGVSTRATAAKPATPFAEQSKYNGQNIPLDRIMVNREIEVKEEVRSRT